MAFGREAAMGHCEEIEQQCEAREDQWQALMHDSLEVVLS
jgi:hypothetical protein